MINYSLLSNELTEAPNKYTAQVVNSRSYTFEDIAEHLLRHNTGLSGAVIRGVWEGIKSAVEEYLADGSSVKTELFHIHPSIQGVFDGKEDGFDPGRHKVRLKLRPGSFLREVPKKLRVKKQNSVIKSYVECVTDIKSGSENDSLTPGKNIRITGHRLKIHGDDKSCGIYFIPEKSTVAPVKVEASDVAMNKPSQIIAVIPKLNKGKWYLRLVTQYSTGKRFLKRPPIIGYDKSFTVA